jgi:hypothetical protein
LSNLPVKAGARSTRPAGSALVAVATSLIVMAVAAGNGVAFAATPPACEPPASRFELTGAFPGSVPAFTTPALQATLVGTSGTFAGRGVFQPKPAPPPAISEGCKENSQFTVTDFQGTLLVQGAAFGPVSLATFPGQPVDARLSVHFGSEPNKPVLMFRSDEPVSLGGVPVRSVQIVGGQIVFVK